MTRVGTYRLSFRTLMRFRKPCGNTASGSIVILALSVLLGFACVANSQKIDFRQSANNDSPYALGTVHWIGSILQQNNSRYFEGMSTLQRIIFKDVTSTPGDVHTLTFGHEVTKGGLHAYDFLTSWEQARLAADLIALGEGLLDVVDACGAEPDPDSQDMRLNCTRAHDGSSSVVSIPDAIADPNLGGNISDRIAAYESAGFGDRSLTIHGDAEIVSASISFDG